MSLQFPRTLNAMKHETSCIEERIDLTPEQFANNEEYFKNKVRIDIFTKVARKKIVVDPSSNLLILIHP